MAQVWADTFTDRYGELAAKLPVFASLRNCIDLAIVGAIAAKEQWSSRPELEVFVDSLLPGARAGRGPEMPWNRGILCCQPYLSCGKSI